MPSKPGTYIYAGSRRNPRTIYGKGNKLVIGRRNYRYRAPKGTALAKKVARLSKKVYNLSQNNFIDRAVQLSGISSSGYTQYDWTGQGLIQDGTERDERIGNKITIKSLQLKFRLTYATGSVLSTSDQFNRVRMIVFVIKDIDAVSPPGITDILQTNSVDSFYKKDSEVKYTILYDKLWNLQNPEYLVKTGATATPPSTIVATQSCTYPPFKSVTETIKFANGLALHYKGAAATQPIKNSIGIALISDSSAPGHPYIDMNTRLTYEP